MMTKVFLSGLLASVLISVLSATAFADDDNVTATSESLSQDRDTPNVTIENEEEVQRLNLTLRHTSIRAQVVAAMEQSDQSFILSSDLEGWSSILLFEVTLEEALDLMLLPHRARWESEDDIIHVMSQSEWIDRHANDQDGNMEALDESDATDTHEATASDDAEIDQDITDQTGSFDIRVTDLDIIQVLELLAIQSHQSMIVSDGVSGKITCILLDVTFDTALNEVLGIHEIKRVDLDNAIWIMTQEEWEAHFAQPEEEALQTNGEAATDE